MNNNMIFELECGPDNDRRTLKLELPFNNIVENAILVSYTGGVDSALLLYLLAKLNNEQSIPYFIQPIVIDNRLGSADDSTNKFAAGIAEHWPRISDTIRSFSKTFPNSQILPLVKKTADPTKVQTSQIEPAVYSFYKQGNYQRIYSGINEVPGEDEVPGGYVRPSKELIVHPWYAPFYDLKKTHIMDIIIQLDSLEILELCTKCPRHVNLEDNICSSFNCRERWWGLSKLGRQDLITRYFIKRF